MKELSYYNKIKFNRSIEKDLIVLSYFDYEKFKDTVLRSGVDGYYTSGHSYFNKRISSDYPIHGNLGKYNGKLPDNKRYYTFYKASNMYDYSRSIVGDMMGEVITISNPTKTWNGNNVYFATSSYPWVKRGGSFRGGSYSGIFDFGITDAAPRGDKTFRVILSLY